MSDFPIQITIDHHTIFASSLEPFEVRFLSKQTVDDRDEFKLVLAWLFQQETERYADSGHASGFLGGYGSEAHKRYDRMKTSFSDLALHIQHFRDGIR